MAFYSTAVLIVLTEQKLSGTPKQAILVGFLAGAIAGAKYTGCVVAGSIALAYV